MKSDSKYIWFIVFGNEHRMKIPYRMYYKLTWRFFNTYLRPANTKRRDTSKMFYQEVSISCSHGNCYLLQDFISFLFCSSLRDYTACSLLGCIIPSQNSGYRVTRLCTYCIMLLFCTIFNVPPVWPVVLQGSSLRSAPLLSN